MKRVWCLVLVISLLISAIPAVSTAVGGYLWMVDAENGVNVRSAKKNGTVIKTLRKGEIILVCEEDKLWVGYRMEDGNIGYCYKEYLHIAHAEEIEAWENRKKQGITLTNEEAFAIGTIKEDCKVYKRANGKVIGYFEAGDEVYIRQTGKFWYKIVWEDRELAYIQSKYVEFDRPNIPADGDFMMVACKKYAPIYEENDAHSKKIGKVQNGHYVVVIDDSDEEYCFVYYDPNCNEGYISKKYLREP